MTKFLSFHLGAKDTAGIPVEYITELFQVSLAEILPVPQVSNCVLGIYNWRGEMLWLVDLEHLLGYAPLSQADIELSKLMTIAIQMPGKSLGLVVRQLTDIEWLDPHLQKTPADGLFPPKLLPFLQGYFINEANKIFMSLDAEAIIQSLQLTTDN